MCGLPGRPRGRIATWKRSQSCVRYRCRRGVEASLWATAIIRAARNGHGDVAPFTGPRDCRVCNGSGFEGPIETTLPHSDFGDPDCCGCLNGVLRGDQADIVCNECGTVLRTVPVANVGQTLTELEITLEVASEMCPHCGSVNLFPGFSKMLAFICRQCGKAVLRAE